MSVYLTWLPDVLRAAGLTVVEYDGWAYRAKSSGGYVDATRPWGAMWHHTASQADPANDASYMCYGADAAPVANVLVARDGVIWLLAAGPTNTNGKGGPVTWSKGTVPTDAMNSYAFGAELANAGTGAEPYPQAQIDAAFALSNAVNGYMGNQPGDVCTHEVWAPGRKIDPATAAAVQGPWRPGAVTDAGTWSLPDLAAEADARYHHAPPPAEDDTVLYVEVSDAWARFVATGQADPLVLWQVGYTTGDRAQVHANTLRHVTVSQAQLAGCTLVGELPPADDGGGPARWGREHFYEVIPRG